MLVAESAMSEARVLKECIEGVCSNVVHGTYDKLGTERRVQDGRGVDEPSKDRGATFYMYAGRPY